MASHVDTQVINTIMGQPYGSCRLPHSLHTYHEIIIYKQHTWAIPNHSHSLQKRVRRSIAEDKTSWNSIFQADFGLARSTEISFQIAPLIQHFVSFSLTGRGAKSEFVCKSYSCFTETAPTDFSTAEITFPRCWSMFRFDQSHWSSHAASGFMFHCLPRWRTTDR